MMSKRLSTTLFLLIFTTLALHTMERRATTKNLQRALDKMYNEPFMTADTRIKKLTKCNTICNQLILMHKNKFRSSPAENKTALRKLQKFKRSICIELKNLKEY